MSGSKLAISLKQLKLRVVEPAVNWKRASKLATKFEIQGTYDDDDSGESIIESDEENKIKQMAARATLKRR